MSKITVSVAKHLSVVSDDFETKVEMYLNAAQDDFQIVILTNHSGRQSRMYPGAIQAGYGHKINKADVRKYVAERLTPFKFEDIDNIVYQAAKLCVIKPHATN